MLAVCEEGDKKRLYIDKDKIKSAYISTIHYRIRPEYMYSIYLVRRHTGALHQIEKWRHSHVKWGQSFFQLTL